MLNANDLSILATLKKQNNLFTEQDNALQNSLWCNGAASNYISFAQLFNMQKERIEFPKGNQKKLIDFVWKQSGVYWRDLPQLIDINYNTLRTYYYEKSRLSKFDLNKIEKSIKITNLAKKFDGKKIAWKPENAFANKNSLGENRTKEIPIKITFKKEPEKLQTNKKMFSAFDLKKKIKLPEKIDSLLAEETGIHLGDGFLSDKKYDFRVKGDKKEEKEYYKKVIKKIYKKLYNIDLPLKNYETTFGFELYSKAVWEFKTKVLELTAGRKDCIEIPKKFKVNDVQILCGLVRGFFDTDGCIYFRSQNKNKHYYPVINVTGKSEKLLLGFNEILKMLGFQAKIHKNREYYSIIMNGYANFKKYNELIGWHSPKHLNKIKKWSEKYPEIAKKYMVAIV